MTDNLAEAKRHIRALLEMSEDLFPGFIPGCGSYLAAEARKDDARREAQAYLDAEGQTVEGGDDQTQMTIERFCEEARDKTGGPTPELRRVYQAYLDSQKWKDGPQVEHDRTVKLAITDEMALQGAWAPINEIAQRVGLQPFDPRMAPDINEIARARLILHAALNGTKT